MLKTSSPTGSSTILQSIDVADKNEIGDDKSGGDKINLSNLSASKKSNKVDYLTFEGAKRGGANTKKDVKAAEDSDYLNPGAKKAFNYLWHAFIQAPILQHFDLKWHIRIETKASSYAISKVLSQLTLEGLCQWHPMAYYLNKIIKAKTLYKTHNNELLPIVEGFEIWRHYLKSCKYKVLVFTNHNNICCFMDTKPDFLSGLIGQRAFSLLFANKSLPKKSKWDCRYSILFFSVK